MLLVIFNSPVLHFSQENCGIVDLGNKFISRRAKWSLVIRNFNETKDGLFIIIMSNSKYSIWTFKNTASS